MRRGWFILPGIQDGDRTPEQQLAGLAPALAECAGKTVLDLGCAEGVISREFANAGASEVLGIELLTEHLNIARKVCKMCPQVRFINAELAGYIAEHPDPRQFDIVLALGIIQKLKNPGIPMEFAIRSSRNLVLFRAPARACDGIVKSKFGNTTCNVPALMKKHGLIFDQKIAGAMGEAVEYYRRTSIGKV